MDARTIKQNWRHHWDRTSSTSVIEAVCDLVSNDEAHAGVVESCQRVVGVEGRTQDAAQDGCGEGEDREYVVMMLASRYSNWSKNFFSHSLISDLDRVAINGVL